MAITDKSSNSDDITPAAITGAGQSVAAPAQSAASNLPAALEPELRRIIDTAVARVAAIELEAIKEARELTQRSEQEARDALRFALDRAFNLINSLELLAATVNGMAEALKVELDDAITALRNVPEPESALSRELAQQPEPAAPAVEEPAAAVEAAEPEPHATEPQPEPAAAAEPEPEPAPEPEPEPIVAAEPEPEPVVAAEPEPEPVVAAEPEPAPATESQPEPRPEAVAAAEPEPEPPAEPRVKLAPLVRPAEAPRAQEPPAEEALAEPAPEPELVTAGAPAPEPAPTPPPRKAGRVRRFFTR